MKKDWDKTFLQIAKIISEHSTCSRVQVGAVLTKDRRIISCGYNGVPSGQKECEEHFKIAFALLDTLPKNVLTFENWVKSDEFSELHREFSINNELHGEQNALGYAARNGIETNGSTMYLTISPCKQCAKLMIAAGVKRVVFSEKYNRSEDDGIPLLQLNNVECVLYE